MCDACSIELAAATPLRRPAALTAAIAGGIAGLVPFVLTVTTTKIATTNGHSVVTFRDWAAVGGGAVAALCGLVAIALAARTRAASTIGLGVVVLALGGLQLGRGFGAIGGPGGDTASTEAPAFAVPAPTAPTAPDEPATCPDKDHCFDLGDALAAKGDKAAAAIAYRRSCDLGIPSGCNNAAIALGSTSPEAMALFARACDGGVYLTCGALAGDAVVAKDYPRAKLLGERACDHDDPRGCANLGVLYQDGLGVPVDKARSVGLFAKACDKGDKDQADACNGAGVALVQGDGVAKDVPRAMAYFETACTRAARWCYSLGVSTATGQGVAKDEAKARGLYTKACDAGSLIACNNLGDMLNRGLGGAKDKAAATALFKKACDGGVELGCSNLKP